MANLRVTVPASSTDNVTQSGIIDAAAEYVGPYRHRKEAGMPEYNQVHLLLSGTWAGTMKLQTSFPDRGEWADVPDGEFTSNTSEGLTFAGSVDVRVYCSAYTSGTCFAALIHQ